MVSNGGEGCSGIRVITAVENGGAERPNMVALGAAPVKRSALLNQHAASLWQCEFFSKRILTIKGIRKVFVLAFLHVETRRLVLSPATFHPDEAWVVAQTNRFVDQARKQKLRVAPLQRDRDSKFTKEMSRVLRSKRVRVKVTEYRAPNTNAFV